MWQAAAASEVSGASGPQPTKIATVLFSAGSSGCTTGRTVKPLGAGYVVGMAFVAVRLFHASRAIDGNDLFFSAETTPTATESSE